MSEIINAIVNGNIEQIEKLVKKSIKENNSKEILSMIPKALEIVEQKLIKGECFIPEILRSAKATKKVFELVKPNNFEELPSVVLGTIKGNVHDIGKELIKTITQSLGFVVHDIGVDVTPDDFVNKLNETKSKILLISALTTDTHPAIKETIQKLKEKGLRENIKIVLGGQAISKEFTQEAGADAYSKSIKETLILLNKFKNNNI